MNTRRTYCECEWCNSKNTHWVENDCPDPHYDFPEHDIDSGTVTVNLCRFCDDCDSIYVVPMKFNIKDGEWVKESE